jgi:hypothetical protein
MVVGEDRGLALDLVPGLELRLDRGLVVGRVPGQEMVAGERALPSPT